MNTLQAIVIGGSNGIGLAVVKSLIRDGYYVNVLDICMPDPVELEDSTMYSYRYFDITNIDIDMIRSFCENDAVDFLMITAGVGRVADFEYLHISEIEKLYDINIVGVTKILSLFYDRIKSSRRFYCGVMGSIAGLVSSPMFSVYAASKAAVCRLVESINVELTAFNTENRITNISPGSIKGTKFNGGNNDLLQTMDLARNIIKKIRKSEELYIPQYAEIFADVLKRYHSDPHAFGMSSYQYKKDSGRVQNENKVKIGYLSGTFDLFHIGHLNLLERAKKQCDYLIVGVHPNAAHKQKETFISFEDRKRIVAACRYVDKVVDACLEDNEAWKLWHYTMLFVGSDYKGTDRFEKYETFFSDKGVKIVYFPYTKKTSSTILREAILTNSKTQEKGDIEV